jgi:hypothetical protein
MISPEGFARTLLILDELGVHPSATAKARRLNSALRLP